MAIRELTCDALFLVLVVPISSTTKPSNICMCRCAELLLKRQNARPRPPDVNVHLPISNTSHQEVSIWAHAFELHRVIVVEYGIALNTDAPKLYGSLLYDQSITYLPTINFNLLSRFNSSDYLCYASWQSSSRGSNTRTSAWYHNILRFSNNGRGIVNHSSWGARTEHPRHNAATANAFGATARVCTHGNPGRPHAIFRNIFSERQRRRVLPRYHDSPA